MKLCMIGSGYVGLVSGACFAATGQRVVCVDKDKAKIARLEAGEIPIYEPGLDKIIEDNRAAGRLTFSSDLVSAIADADAVFIAVGTPQTMEGDADLGAVEAVSKEIAAAAKRPLVVVLKSTVSIGTNARVARIVASCKHPISVVSNPEFLKEGDAVHDFMHPDRIVVGVREDDKRARDLMERMYHPLNLSNNKIVWMNPESAELTKYAANTMLAMRISFMNELSGLCEQVGADIHSVRRGIGSDPRIGSQFLHAGPGYGGSCFPKDVKALVATARKQGVELELAAATDRVNVRHRGFVARKVKNHFGGDLRGSRVAIWGLAFKPNTDDVREAPSLTTIDFLIDAGAEVIGHDPEAIANIQALYGDKIKLVKDAYAAIDGADALVLLTEWREYQHPDFPKIKSLLRTPVIFDGRNIWSSYKLASEGFRYYGIGTQPA